MPNNSSIEGKLNVIVDGKNSANYEKNAIKCFVRYNDWKTGKSIIFSIFLQIGNACFRGVNVTSFWIEVCSGFLSGTILLSVPHRCSAKCPMEWIFKTRDCSTETSLELWSLFLWRNSKAILINIKTWLSLIYNSIDTLLIKCCKLFHQFLLICPNLRWTIHMKTTRPHLHFETGRPMF